MYISKARTFQLPLVRNTKRMNPQNPAGGCSSVQLVEPNLTSKDKDSRLEWIKQLELEEGFILDIDPF
jgi:hypothetical protein